MRRALISLIICLSAVCLTKLDVSADTGKMYGIGSVSKVFTAASVMKLAEDGKIDLDEPVVTYIPDFVMADDRFKDITPRMLLSHSSGFMGMTDNNGFLVDDGDTYNHDNFLNLLETQTLKHDPGDRSIYSNDSFTLAEILVERVSGMSFTEFIETNFSEPLSASSIKTPQSDFDRDLLAPTYIGSRELRPQYLNVIGSGGIYSTMEDLCKFGMIFTESHDGSILSKESVMEMTKNQHRMELIEPGADTVYTYGLGWDSVNLYPYSEYGIKALSKGGATGTYYTNLTVLPEQNIAAAVASSGEGGLELLIAQEIILTVLAEEGLIPPGSELGIPAQNLEPALVPDSISAYEGLYDLGIEGMYDASFTESSMILTPVGVRNERPMEFIYNTDGDFVSTEGNVLGVNASNMAGVTPRGITTLRFTEDGNYLVCYSYEDIPGLGRSAEAMPLGERVMSNPVPSLAQEAWDSRADKEYLLVNEKYTSAVYTETASAKVLTDSRMPGYVIKGIYDEGGKSFPAVKIKDENTALGYQSVPTVTGRDIVNLSAETENGAEYLNINNYRYIDSDTAVPFSQLEGSVVIKEETVWVNIGDSFTGREIIIRTPENGSWFVYDEEMTCISTSLEKNPREVIILPENGRISFAGEAGAEFLIK